MARKDSKQKVDSRDNAQSLTTPQAAGLCGNNTGAENVFDSQLAELQKVDSSTATSLNKPAKDSKISTHIGAESAFDTKAAGGRIFDEKAGLCSGEQGDKTCGLSTPRATNSPLFRKKPTPDDNAILQVYSRLPIIFNKGQGAYLYDTQGREYLDFGAGIAVNALGYGNTAFNTALKEQIDKLLHISNLYYNLPAIEAATKLAKASGLDRVFFTNSGAEACEGALKVAKKYAYEKGIKSPQIIAMKDSFHGRTLGALSVTGNSAYQKPFKPLLSGVKFARFNDIASVERLITPKTCAIMLETIQGEGGVTPASKEFLHAMRKLCDRHDMLLILDEIQCGMGRSGSMFAYEQYGIMPDIITTAKALGCGVPVGAFVLSQKVADLSLKPGDHGSTYGGNPFVCAAVSKVFDIFEELQLVQRVIKLTPSLTQVLQELCDRYDFLHSVRGKGFLQGIQIDPKSKIQAKHIVQLAIEEGLIILSASHNVLRFAPPLIITQEHIELMRQRLIRALDRVS